MAMFMTTRNSSLSQRTQLLNSMHATQREQTHSPRHRRTISHSSRRLLRSSHLSQNSQANSQRKWKFPHRRRAHSSRRLKASACVMSRSRAKAHRRDTTSHSIEKERTPHPFFFLDKFFRTYYVRNCTCFLSLNIYNYIR